jgi:hypothetical protein
MDSGSNLLTDLASFLFTGSASFVGNWGLTSGYDDFLRSARKAVDSQLCSFNIVFLSVN